MNIYDPFARYYDADLDDYADDVFFYREMARRTGGPILELMCGTGRLLAPLAEDGHNLTGVDSSAAMLDIARARLAAADLTPQVTLIHDDVRTVELPANHFALAFVGLNSFMHLAKLKDQFAALNTVQHTLANDGLLLLDLFNPDPARLADDDSHLVLDRDYELDGRRVFRFVTTRCDLARQINDVTYLYDEVDASGQVTRQVMRFTMRWIYRYELEHLLARAGFMLRSVYGSYDLDSYTSDSPRLIGVASRKE